MDAALQKTAKAAAFGDWEALEALLRYRARPKGWSPDTLRVRLDGARALWKWWRELPTQPPLHCLGSSDHQAFLRAHAHLGRATLRTYLKGARAAQEAVLWGMGFGGSQAAAPWRGLGLPSRPRRLPEWSLEGLSPRIVRKLTALRNLMGCGLSLPVVCDLRWSDLDLEGGWAQTYRGRVRLDVGAMLALQALGERPPYPFTPVLGWRPYTARRWVRRIRSI